MKATPPEVVTQIQAAFLAGFSASEVARQFSVSNATACRIKAGMADALKNIDKESKVKIDDLLIDSVQSHLEGLKGIAGIAKDEDYLRKQSPEGLATLHQRLEDHAFRLIESAGVIEESLEEEEEQPEQAGPE